MAVCRFIFNLKNCWDISYPRGRDNKRSGYNLIEGDMYTFFKIKFLLKISGGNSRISLDRLIFVLQYNFSIYFILDKKSRS